MSRHLFVRARLLAAASLFLGAPVSAQQAVPRPDSSMVPTELAIAFARGFAPGDSAARVEFYPGLVAAAVNGLVSLPAASRVIGSVVLGRNTYVFGTTTLPPDSVLAWYASDYSRRGWSAEALVRVMAGQLGGGFRQPPPRRPSTFCNAGQEADVAATRSAEGWTSFRIRLASVATLCNLSLAVRPTPRTPLPLPLIYDPPNTSVRPECFAAFGSTQQSQTQMATTMEPSALLEHYGKQLETQGWSPAPSTVSTSTGTWTRRDSTGAMQVAVVSVRIPPTVPTCRNATLEITTMRTP
jgi:hypothetical protein